MKKNKKGFTLIELLAVIVILAIIMVIAVPQILNVINDSRRGAWIDNLNLIADAIEKNTALIDPSTGESKLSVIDLCGDGALTTSKRTIGATALARFNSIVDIDANTTIKCRSDLTTAGDASTATTWIFEFTNTGNNNQFAGRNGTVTCTRVDTTGRNQQNFYVNCVGAAVTNN